MNKPPIAIWTSLIAFLVIPLALLGFFNPEPIVPEVVVPAVVAPITQTEHTLTIRDTTFIVEIADTPAKQAQGLSGRSLLGEREGLLFVFSQPGTYSFWMKDMALALDIVWIGEDGRIVDLTEDARPESYPKTFEPRMPIRYALEVPAGTVARENFAIGDEVSGTALVGL